MFSPTNMINATTNTLPVTKNNFTNPNNKKINTLFTAQADDDVDASILLLEQQIQHLDAVIAPLSGKAKKKLAKIEAELANCNFLINTGLGSKDDKVALCKTKRKLRERRIKLWDQLEILPSLEEERSEAVRQLNALRCRHGIMGVGLLLS